MPPVSPRQKSTNTLPSTSQKRAPSARSTNTGWSPGHRVIQFIGTPNSSDAVASSDSCPERAWRSRKSCRSRSINERSRDRSIVCTSISPQATTHACFEPRRRPPCGSPKSSPLPSGDDTCPPWLRSSLTACSLPVRGRTAHAERRRAPGRPTSGRRRPGDGRSRGGSSGSTTSIGNRPFSVAIGNDGDVWYRNLPLGAPGRPPRTRSSCCPWRLFDRFGTGHDRSGPAP